MAAEEAISLLCFGSLNLKRTLINQKIFVTKT